MRNCKSKLFLDLYLIYIEVSLEIFLPVVSLKIKRFYFRPFFGELNFNWNVQQSPSTLTLWQQLSKREKETHFNGNFYYCGKSGDRQRECRSMKCDENPKEGPQTHSLREIKLKPKICKPIVSLSLKPYPRFRTVNKGRIRLLHHPYSQEEREREREREIERARERERERERERGQKRYGTTSRETTRMWTLTKCVSTTHYKPSQETNVTNL